MKDKKEDNTVKETEECTVQRFKMFRKNETNNHSIREHVNGNGNFKNIAKKNKPMREEKEILFLNLNE